MYIFLSIDLISEIMTLRKHSYLFNLYKSFGPAFIYFWILTWVLLSRAEFFFFSDREDLERSHNTASSFISLLSTWQSSTLPEWTTLPVSEYVGVAVSYTAEPHSFTFPLDSYYLSSVIFPHMGKLLVVQYYISIYISIYMHIYTSRYKFRMSLLGTLFC